MKRFPAASPALLIGSVLLLTACASVPLEPSTQMTKAKSAVDQAERAGAREYATAELNASTQKMAQGQSAASKGDRALSEDLFEESYADAHLAQITAESAKSAKDAADVDRSITTLQNEASRSSAP